MKEELHTHNGILNYTDGADEGCETCLNNIKIMTKEYKSSPQPEEWESEYDNEFSAEDGHDFVPGGVRTSAIKSFIKTEIRKAEERKDKYYQERLTNIIEDYKERYPDLYKEYYGCNIIEYLEALKK